MFFIILRHQLKIQLNKLNQILSNCLFFIILSSIFTIISQNFSNQQNLTQYLIAIILFSLTCVAIFSNNNFLKDDYDDGNIEQIIRKLNNFETYIIAKITANFISNHLPIIIFAPLFVALNDNNYNLTNLTITLLLSAIAINAISCFSGSLSILNNNSSLSAIITLPILVPILILTFNQITLESSKHTTTLFFITILSLTITTIATTKITKIALE